MRLVKALIISLSLLYVDQCFAYTGNELYRDMLEFKKYENGVNYNSGGANFYMGYVSGFSASYIEGVTICIGTGNITTGQLSNVVAQYINQHPEMLHLPAFYLVDSALKRSFPCKK
jgi:hypothetical protein